MLKKTRIVFFSLFFIAIFFFAKANTLTALANLDEIQEYAIRIEPYQDGSLSMTYHIKWKVLDSDSEGPLEWVKIGIPNEDAEEFEAISKSIKKIRYNSEGGDYVRIDLDRKYYQGEIVDLEFKLHQHNMYVKSGEKRSYSFTPGWFPDIQVDKMTISWQEWGVEKAHGDWTLEDGYYRFETSLDEGEKFTVKVRYDNEAFSRQDDWARSASGSQNSDGTFIPAIALIGIPLVGCGFLLLFSDKIAAKIRQTRGLDDVYTSHSGIGRGHRGPHTGGFHGGGGGCACACACACAGGGRAGCSKKDFYGTKLKTQSIRRALWTEAKLKSN